jgi:hypothetical protein
MKTYALLLIFILAALSTEAQDDTGFWSTLVHAATYGDMVWTSGIHPSTEISLSPPSQGYGFGVSPSLRLDLQRRHFMLGASAGYGFVRKVDDNDQVPHEHGHTRDASVSVYWRRGRNFTGPSASWGETAVTPYRKYSWAPAIDVGHDFSRLRTVASYFRSLREYADYPSMTQFTPGPGQPEVSHYCICGNGTSGVGLDLLYALGSRASSHVLLHYSLSVVHFHETVTDPYNTELTAEQKSNTDIAGSVSFGVVYRR